MRCGGSGGSGGGRTGGDSSSSCARRRRRVGGRRRRCPGRRDLFTVMSQSWRQHGPVRNFSKHGTHTHTRNQYIHCVRTAKTCGVARKPSPFGDRVFAAVTCGGQWPPLSGSRLPTGRRWGLWSSWMQHVKRRTSSVAVMRSVRCLSPTRVPRCHVCHRAVMCTVVQVLDALRPQPDASAREARGGDHDDAHRFLSEEHE